MLLGFKKRFADPIKIGTKVFTIRKRRKVRPKVGETIHMYSGLRTKHTELISNKEKLQSIQTVRILIKRWQEPDNGPWEYEISVFVDRKYVKDIQSFARFDGFKNMFEWADYWLTDEKGKKKNRTGALMEIYHWTDLKY
jgi:hypothetical protein